MNSSILIITIILTFAKFSQATQIAELNETNVFLSINSQLTDLRSELKQQRNFMSEVVKESQSFPQNCAESKTDGIYEILLPNYSSKPFKVFCNTDGWIYILRRQDGSVNFHRSWNMYKKGFGDLDGEFFLGLDKIHALTAERSQELLVVLTDFQNTTVVEYYEKFAIGDEEESFALNTLGRASGEAGDSLRTHHGMKFSTYDRENDREPNRHCAEEYTAAWWYRACHDSNLAGVYNNNSTGKGINWRTFHGVNYSLKYAAMLIRPRK